MNKAADRVANAVLDKGGPIRHVPLGRVMGGHMRLASDGGLRKGGPAVWAAVVFWRSCSRHRWRLAAMLGGLLADATVPQTEWAAAARAWTAAAWLTAAPGAAPAAGGQGDAELAKEVTDLMNEEW